MKFELFFHPTDVVVCLPRNYIFYGDYPTEEQAIAAGDKLLKEGVKEFEVRPSMSAAVENK